MRKNSGILVALSDGRVGQLFHRDRKMMVNGKVPVYTYDDIKQGDLFNPKADLSSMKQVGKKILADPKTLTVIGFFD
jgi:hypothetical protein